MVQDDEVSERALHGFDDDTERLAQQIFDYVIDRVRMSPPPLDAPRAPADLAAATGETVTDDGIGWERALALFRDVLAPACISSDHPRYLGFVPTAPAEAATLFDLVVSASSIYGDWWIEGAGAIHAENQALRWLAGLAGFPETAGGVFLSGGTAGNLTAMTVARETWRARGGHASRASPARPARIPRSGSRRRSSTCRWCRWSPTNAAGLTGERLAAAIEQADVEVFAAIATGGATNTGVVDDLDGVGHRVPGARRVDARRRRVRRRGDGGAIGPSAVPRDRAGRLVRRRPPQVVVLPVRLCRARVSGSEPGACRAHPAGGLPRGARRRPRRGTRRISPST